MFPAIPPVMAGVVQPGLGDAEVVAVDAQRVAGVPAEAPTPLFFKAWGLPLGT